MKRNMSKLLLMMLMTTVSFVFIGCGNDEPSEKADEFSADVIEGFWYSEDDGEFEALDLSSYGIGEYVSGICGNAGSVTTKTISWDNKTVGKAVIKSAGVGSLVLVDGGDLIAFKSIDGTKWNNLKKTGTLDGEAPSTPGVPDEPSITSTDFVGIWKLESSGFYQFESNGKATYYWCSSSNDESLNGDSDSGSWYFDSSTSELHTSGFKVLGDRIRKVTEMTPTYFKADGFRFDRRETLPNISNTPSDDSRIYGTWKATDYTDTYTVTFNENGVVKEVWTDGSDSETSVAEYTFRNGNLEFEGTLAFISVVGNGPKFNVKFGSGNKPATMTISDPNFSSSSLTFKRQ